MPIPVSVLGLSAALALTLFFGVMNFTVWRVEPRDRVPLWLVAWLTASSIFLSCRWLQYASFDQAVYAILPRVMLTGSYSLAWIGFEIANTFIGYRPSRRERGLVAALTFLLVALLWLTHWIVTDQVFTRTLAFGDSFHGVVVGPLYLSASLLILALGFIPLVRLIRASDGTIWENRIMALGFLVTIVFSLCDFISTTFNLRWIRFTDYSYLPIALLFGSIQIRRYAQVYQSMESMVEERTTELRLANQSLMIEINQHSQAVVALRESEERFRRFSQLAQEGIFIHTEGDIVDVNPYGAEMFGYTTEEFIGKRVYNITAPNSRSDVLEHIQQRDETPYQVTGLRKDGTTFPIRIFSRNMRYRDQMASVIVVRDLTEQKQTEQVLKQRADEFTALYDVSRELAAEHDLGTLLETICRHAARLLGESSGGIYLHNPKENDLELVLALGVELPGNVHLKMGEGAAGRVAQTRQPLIVSSYQTWEGRAEAFKDVPIQAVIQVPMLARGELIGVLAVHAVENRHRRFSEADLRLLSLFAGQAASAVRTMRLLTETRERLTELETVSRISTAMRAAQTLDELLPRLIDETLAALGIGVAMIWLFDPNSRTLYPAIARGWTIERLNHPILFEEKIIQRILAKSCPYILREFCAEPLVREFANSMLLPGWGGGFLPIRASREIIGVMFVAVELPRELTPNQVALLKILAEIAGNAIQRTRLHQSLQEAYDTTLEGWTRALDLRDQETEGHTTRVTKLTLRLARALGISGGELDHVRRGALLHDIGKIGIPDSILLKPGPLSSQELTVMRQHPIYAYELLSPILYLRPALDIPYYHHEKWDGTGYPRGLDRERIPFVARIFAMVDVWDAIRSDRPYRAAWSQERALSYMREQSGTHFDPNLLEPFLQMVSTENG